LDHIRHGHESTTEKKRENDWAKLLRMAIITFRGVPHSNARNHPGVANPASLSGALGHGPSVERVPVPHVVDRPGGLMTSHTEHLHMANGTRFPFGQSPNAMPPNPPKTGVAVRTVQLMAFPALIVHVAAAAVIDMPGFNPIP